MAGEHSFSCSNYTIGSCSCNNCCWFIHGVCHTSPLTFNGNGSSPINCPCPNSGWGTERDDHFRLWPWWHFWFPHILFDCLSFLCISFWWFSFLLQTCWEWQTHVRMQWGNMYFHTSLNKREMRSRALRLLLCDRNHIIDWHTELSVKLSQENQGCFWRKQRQVWGSWGLWVNSISLFATRSHSLCVSAPLSHSACWLETIVKGIVVWNTEREDYSLLPSTADVICVPLNCCFLSCSKLQSHCVKHAPRLVRVCFWQDLCTSVKKKKYKFTWHLFWVDWVLSVKYEKLHNALALPYLLPLPYYVFSFFSLSSCPSHDEITLSDQINCMFLACIILVLEGCSCFCWH